MEMIASNELFSNGCSQPSSSKISILDAFICGFDAAKPGDGFMPVIFPLNFKARSWITFNLRSDPISKIDVLSFGIIDKNLSIDFFGSLAGCS